MLKDVPPPLRCFEHVTCEHDEIHIFVTMPSEPPLPLWKPWLLSWVAYTSEGVAWQMLQLKTICSVDGASSPSIVDDDKS